MDEVKNRFIDNKEFVHLRSRYSEDDLIILLNRKNYLVPISAIRDNSRLDAVRRGKPMLFFQVYVNIDFHSINFVKVRLVKVARHIGQYIMRWKWYSLVQVVVL